MSATAAPDHQAFLDHLAAAPFLLGEAEGRWRLVGIEWPIAYIAVSAAPRPNAPAEYLVRFECSGYPVGVTGRLWDTQRQSMPEPHFWPTGKARVPAVFRTDWNGGTCLYLPCDKVAIGGHEGWLTQLPSMCWSRAKGIVCYLEVLSELLNSNDYTGARSA